MVPVWHWIQANANVISALTNIGMLLVWLLYLQLFFREFKQRRSQQIFIHQGPSHSLTSTCLLINLSEQPLHVIWVEAVAHTANRSFKQKITTYHHTDLEGVSHKQTEDIFKQGPLTSGLFISLGDFREILGRLSLQAPPTVQTADKERGETETEDFVSSVESIEIRVAAIHPAYSAAVGASRVFNVSSEEGRVRIYSPTSMTTQLTSYWQRRQVQHWIRNT